RVADAASASDRRRSGRRGPGQGDVASGRPRRLRRRSRGPGALAGPRRGARAVAPRHRGGRYLPPTLRVSSAPARKPGRRCAGTATSCPAWPPRMDRTFRALIRRTSKVPNPVSVTLLPWCSDSLIVSSTALRARFPSAWVPWILVATRDATSPFPNDSATVSTSHGLCLESSNGGGCQAARVCHSKVDATDSALVRSADRGDGAAFGCSLIEAFLDSRATHWH